MRAGLSINWMKVFGFVLVLICSLYFWFHFLIFVAMNLCTKRLHWNRFFFHKKNAEAHTKFVLMFIQLVKLNSRIINRVRTLTLWKPRKGKKPSQLNCKCIYFFRIFVIIFTLTFDRWCLVLCKVSEWFLEWKVTRHTDIYVQWYATEVNIKWW